MKTKNTNKSTHKQPSQMLTLCGCLREEATFQKSDGGLDFKLHPYSKDQSTFYFVHQLCTLPGYTLYIFKSMQLIMNITYERNVLK